MILSKTAKVRLWGSNMKPLFEFGYKGKKGDIIDVKIEHLQKGSKAKVEVLCDICKKNKMTVAYEVYNRVVEKTGSYVCRECSYEKTAQTCLEKYGFKTSLQNKLVKEKIKQTNLERYGVEYYGQTKECHDRIRQTCLDKYGVEHFAQSQEIKDKKAKTIMERYGADCVFHVEEFKNKIIDTNLKKYGVKSVLKAPEIKEKIRKTNMRKYGVPHNFLIPQTREKIMQTYYENGTKISSKQQRYLNNLYNGDLNYPIKNYSADICLLQDKLVIEYDGGGHDLRVVLGQLTQEEFNQKEIIRSNTIKREGYKQMRIISSKDLLPLDDILLQMLQQAREYFNTTSHSWINYDIDNSKMINAENKDIGGVFFDYGKLRKIKEPVVNKIA